MRNIKRIGLIFLRLLLLSLLLICIPGQALAANPFMEQWERIPDGEPRVFTDPETGTQRMYVYGSHDTQSGGYCGPDHVVWSAPVDDLTNWRHDGVAFEISQLSGLTFTPEGGTEQTYSATGVLFAPDVVYHPQLNKYYMFVFTATGHHIFVAESDTPTGPFTNPRYVGQGFDPAVLVDDVKDKNGNQRVYLYWSNESERSCYACELDPTTMQKIDSTLHVPINHSSASNGNGTMPHRNLSPFYFFEGPSIRKVKDTYVLTYAKTDAGSGNGKLAEIGYCFSDNPYGDPTMGTAWEFGGVVVDNLGEVIENPYVAGTTTTTYKGGNNHGGMIEANGQWYQIYHRKTGIGLLRQSMVEAIDLYFDENGKLVIEQAEITSQGFETNGLNPYKPQYAGSACFGLGSYVFDTNPSLNFDPNAEREDWYPVTNLRNHSWLGYKYFNFADGVEDGMGLSLVLSLKEYAAGTVNVYAADPKETYSDPEQPRTLIGSIRLAGGNSTEHTVEIPVEKLEGTKAIYLEFLSTRSSTICELNKLWFVESEASYADTICLDGVELENFSPYTYGYTVKLESLSNLPKVTAQAAEGLIVTVSQPTTEYPVATVTVASANKTNTYTITFKKLVLPSSWDFTKTDKETVLSDWEIVNPSSDSSTWSIDENGLHLAVLPGDLYQTNNSAQNVFTLNSPGNWIMDTKVSFNQAPSKLYHQAVIMAFQDVDNYVKLSYEYGVNTMGDNTQKSYVQFANETDAKMIQSFQAPTSTEEIYYRLKKFGNTYTAYYSLDGENYVKMGSYEADFAEPKIALAAFNGGSYTDDLVATFEYLTYTELPLPEEVTVSFSDCTPIGNATMANSCIEWITTVGSGFSFTYNNETEYYLQAAVGINYSSYVGGDTVSILSGEISTFTTAGLGNWSNYQDFDTIGYVTLKPGLNTITFRSETINGVANIGYNMTEVRLFDFQKLSDVKFDRTALFTVKDFNVFGNAVLESSGGSYTNVGYMTGEGTGFSFTYTNWSDKPVYATVGAKITTNYGTNTCTTYAITANGEAPLLGSTYYPPNFATWAVSEYTVVNDIGMVLLQPGENTIVITAVTDSQYGMNVSEVYLRMEEYGGAQIGNVSYETVTQAIAAANGEVVKLLNSTNEAIVVDKDVIIDLAGHTLGNVTVAQDATLTLIDSATDDYEGEYGSATVTGAVKTFAEVNGKNYLVVGENNVYSAHCYEAAITHVSLKPADDALGYKAQVKGDEIVLSHVKNIGFNLWVDGGKVKTYEKADTKVSLRLKNILAANGGEMNINATAFVTLAVGEETTIKTGPQQTTTMKWTLQQVNAGWSTYSVAQREAVKTLCDQYFDTVSNWKLNKIYPIGSIGAVTESYEALTGSFSVTTNSGFTADGKLTAPNNGEGKAILKQTFADNKTISVDLYPKSSINSGIYLGASNAADAQDSINAIAVMVESNIADNTGRTDIVIGNFPTWQEYHRLVIEGNNSLFTNGVKEPVNLTVEVNGNVITATVSLISDSSKSATTTYTYTGSYNLANGQVGLRSQYSDCSFDNFRVNDVTYSFDDEASTQDLSFYHSSYTDGIQIQSDNTLMLHTSAIFAEGTLGANVKTNGSHDVGIVFGANEDCSSYYLYRVATASQYAELVKVENGTETVLDRGFHICPGYLDIRLEVVVSDGMAYCYYSTDDEKARCYAANEVELFGERFGLWAKSTGTTFQDVTITDCKENRKADVLIFGHSYTEMWTNYASYFPEYPSIENIGIGGTVAAHWAAFTDEIIAFQPKLGIFNIGINDLNSGITPESAVESMENVLISIKDALPEFEVVLVSVNHCPSQSANVEKIARINALMRNLAATYDWMYYAEAEYLFCTDKTDPLSADSSLFIDGLHPAPEGYALLAELIRSAAKGENQPEFDEALAQELFALKKADKVATLGIYSESAYTEENWIKAKIYYDAAIAKIDACTTIEELKSVDLSDEIAALDAIENKSVDVITNLMNDDNRIALSAGTWTKTNDNTINVYNASYALDKTSTYKDMEAVFNITNNSGDLGVGGVFLRATINLAKGIDGYLINYSSDQNQLQVWHVENGYSEDNSSQAVLTYLGAVVFGNDGEVVGVDFHVKIEGDKLFLSTFEDYKAGNDPVLVCDLTNNGQLSVYEEGHFGVMVWTPGLYFDFTLKHITGELNTVNHACSMKLDKANFMTNSGKTVQIGVEVPCLNGSIEWTSDNETVATVDENGNVTAHAQGDAIITATAGAVSATCRVSVDYEGQNPILPPSWGLYICDPEPYTIDGRMYVFGSKDRPMSIESDGTGGYCSTEYNIIYTDDMINWTDVGVTLRLEDIPEAYRGGYRLWGPSCLFKAREAGSEKDKYYFIANTNSYSSGMVLFEADSPTGPFKNPRPMTLDGKVIGNLDPGVLADDDGKVYFAYQHDGYRFSICQLDPTDFSKLLPDTVTEVTDVFKEGNPDAWPDEGQSLKKRGDTYYYLNMLNWQPNNTQRIPVKMAYLMADNPLGPWRYGGIIIDTYHYLNSSNIQGGFAELNGQWYVCYHMPTPDSSASRYCWIDPISFNDDGTIKQIQPTSSGAKGSFRVGEKIQSSSGVHFSGERGDNRIVQRYEGELNRWWEADFKFTDYPETWYSEAGQFIGYRYMDFVADIQTFSITARTETEGAVLKIYQGAKKGSENDASGGLNQPSMDGPNGDLIATIQLTNTNNQYQTFTVPASVTEVGMYSFYVVLETAPSQGSVYVDSMSFQ